MLILQMCCKDFLLGFVSLWWWTESKQFERFGADLIERDIIFHMTSFISRHIKNSLQSLALEKKNQS